MDTFPFDSTSVGLSTAFAYRSSDVAEHWELVVAFDQNVDVQRGKHGREYRSLSLNLGVTGWLSGW